MDTTLEGYLSSDFRVDRQEIDTLDRHLRMAAETFEKTFCDPQWPYDFVTTEKPQAPTHFSQGTAAMALTAVGRLIGTCKEGLPVPLERDTLHAQWKKCFEALKTDLAKLGPSFPRRKQAHVRSSTFGNDNAITLSHLAELSSVSNIDEDIGGIDNSFGIVKAQLDKLKVGPVDFLSIPQSKGSYQRGNGFVPLRAIRACRFKHPKENFSEIKPFFESILHDQLSFSSIPDSRFDPAELLFCLEGLLLCDRDAVEATLFDRVLHVLSEKQNTNAHWRPNRPFIASPTGYIVLPISVEGANSLMRSVKIMDEERTFDLFASKAAPLLRRFWSWLVAQSVRFEIDGEDCVGWHSEHVNEPNQIHLWDTSQVVEFMIAYRRLLTGHVAHRTLLLSNVKVRQPVSLVETINGQNPTWADVIDDREPLKDEHSDDQAYLQIGKKFVDSRRDGKRKSSYSMLLYGPPGTGKSSLAELIADELKWPLITVTVSDFLGSGGAMVEARAKAIFQMLEAQENTVILFDEIDSFLLDRDSRFYRDQETLFQFITPGMLTKINDLRKAKRSIFIIATNYANRIDPAIKRVGRVDDRILLLPPNLARREAMIEKAWAQQNEDRLEDDRKPLPDYVDAMAKAFCYLGWNDIKDLVKEVFTDPPAVSELIERIKRIDRSTGPKFYGRRFPLERPFEDEIGKEVEWLAKLADESDDQQFARDFADAATQAAAGDARQADITDAAKAFVNDLVAGTKIMKA